MVRVGQLMTQDLVAVDAATSISEIARLMSLRRIGSVFVRRQEEMIGIVTEPDIIRKGISQGRDLRTVSAFEIMSSPIVSIDERRPITEAADLMQSHRTRHLAVSKGDRLVGIVSVRDLLHPVSIDEF
ncbi:CBS domain-containing protein [Nitrospira sp.]|nr:CBS domain-containing protein [Nitrospira sp.]